jgi:endonuclease/exonuclease/phosphatase family metal-dependent hydrolase
VRIFIVFNGKARQYGIAVMAFRIDRVAPVGVIAPHGPQSGTTIHVICVHLGLRAHQRQAQLTMLAEWVNTLPAGDPVVVAGDFNDWRQQANQPRTDAASV